MSPLDSGPWDFGLDVPCKPATTSLHVSWRARRELNAQGCPTLRSVRNGDLSTETQHEVLHDRKAQACSTYVATTPPIDPVEALKDTRALGGWDPWTTIGNQEHDTAVLLGQRDVDLRPYAG